MDRQQTSFWVARTATEPESPERGKRLAELRRPTAQAQESTDAQEYTKPPTEVQRLSCSSPFLCPEWPHRGQAQLYAEGSPRGFPGPKKSDVGGRQEPVRWRLCHQPQEHESQATGP